MINKFDINKNYYTTKRAKYTYIKNRLNSAAAENLFLYLQIIYPNYFDTYNIIFTYL